MDDVGLQVRDGRAGLIPGRDGQKAEALAVHRPQHLAGIEPGDHPIEPVVLDGDLGAVGQDLGAAGHPVKDHPVGIEGPAHTCAVELGRRHRGRYGGVHLKGVLQLPAGDIDPHQGIARSAVGPGAQGGDVKGVGDGDLPGGQGGPNNSGGHHGEVHRHIVRPLRLLHGVDIGVGNETAQGVLLLHRSKLTDGREGVGVFAEDLVEGEPVAREIGLVHRPAEAVGQGGQVMVPGYRLVHGDELVVHQLHPFALLRYRQHPQILGVLPAGDDEGAVDPDGLGQGGVGVPGDDDVDAVHRLGQRIVLPLSVPGAAVGEADDIVGSLLRLKLRHHPFGGFSNGGEGHARHGRRVVRVLPQHTENSHLQAVPLQDGVVGHRIVLQGGRRRVAAVVLQGLGIVGLDDGGQGVAAGFGGGEHVGQALLPVVKLVVAQSGHVIAHGPQSPELRGVGGVDGLKEGAHGEVPSVQGHHRPALGLGLGPLLL